MGTAKWFLSLDNVWMHSGHVLSSKPGRGHVVFSIVIIESEWGFYIVFSMIIKRWHEKWQYATWQWQNTDCIIVYAVFSAKTNSLFTWKVEWPSDNFGSVKPSAVMCYSPNTGAKWMDLLIVLSSYCNTICSVAGRWGVWHQFDCAEWISMLSLFPPTLKSFFVCILGEWDPTRKRLLCACRQVQQFLLRPIPIRTAVHRGIKQLEVRACGFLYRYVCCIYMALCLQSFLWPKFLNALQMALEKLCFIDAALSFAKTFGEHLWKII